MKTILFVCHEASRTGAPILLHEIAKQLDQRSYRLHFIIGRPGRLMGDFESIGTAEIDPIYPHELPYLREVKRVWKRLKVLDRIGPDLLYCNTIHPAKWLLYARLRGIPTLTHVHELSMGFDTLGMVEHVLVRRCSTRFIAVSDAVKNYLVNTQRVPATRIDVVRAGIDPGAFDRVQHRPGSRLELGIDRAFVVGTVGRITAMKGSDLFLQMTSWVKSKSSVPVKFLVVATTEDRAFYVRFQSLLDELNLREDVLLVENATEVKEFYSSMDLYVSTSREDPFPLVVLEAMAMGLPVVGFSVGGIPEAVTPECGVLVNEINPESLANIILKLAHDESKRHEMGEAGRRRIREEFDISKNVSMIQNVIDETIKRPQR